MANPCPSQGEPTSKHAWFKACRRHPGIGKKAPQLNIASILYQHLGDSAYAWPTRETMALDSGMQGPNVSRTIANLCEIGAISTLKTSDLPPEVQTLSKRKKGRAQAYACNFEWAKRVNDAFDLDPKSWPERWGTLDFLSGAKVSPAIPLLPPKVSDTIPCDVGSLSPYLSGKGVTGDTFKGIPADTLIFQKELPKEKNPTQVSKTGVREASFDPPYPLPASRASALESEILSGNSYARAKGGF
jgi:hypothetical protein